MKRRLIGIGILTVVYLTACGDKKKDETPAPPPPKFELTPPLVTMAELSTEQRQRFLDVAKKDLASAAGSVFLEFEGETDGQRQRRDQRLQQSTGALRRYHEAVLSCDLTRPRPTRGGNDIQGVGRVESNVMRGAVDGPRCPISHVAVHNEKYETTAMDPAGLLRKVTMSSSLTARAARLPTGEILGFDEVILLRQAEGTQAVAASGASTMNLKGSFDGRLRLADSHREIVMGGQMAALLRRDERAQEVRMEYLTVLQMTLEGADYVLIRQDLFLAGQRVLVKVTLNGKGEDPGLMEHFPRLGEY